MNRRWTVFRLLYAKIAFREVLGYLSLAGASKKTGRWPNVVFFFFFFGVKQEIGPWFGITVSSVISIGCLYDLL